MGTQIHATENYRRIVELIRAGAIGDVRECHCWLRGGGSAGDRPKETPPIPGELDWDLWLGPRPIETITPATCRMIGITGGILAEVRSATWAAITWTWHFGH